MVPCTVFGCVCLAARSYLWIIWAQSGHKHSLTHHCHLPLNQQLLLFVCASTKHTQSLPSLDRNTHTKRVTTHEHRERVCVRRWFSVPPLELSAGHFISTSRISEKAHPATRACKVRQSQGHSSVLLDRRRRPGRILKLKRGDCSSPNSSASCNQDCLSLNT